MFLVVRCGKENVVFMIIVNVISVFLECKIIYEIVVVYLDVFIGEVSVYFILLLVEFYIK